MKKLIYLIIISTLGFWLNSCERDVKHTANELYQKAKFYEYQGRDDLSLINLEKAHEKNKDDKNILYKLACVYMHKAMYSKSEESFKALIKLDPKYFKAYVGLGNLYYYQGRYIDSIKYWKKAVEINPELRKDRKSYFTDVGMNVVQEPYGQIADKEWKAKVGLNKIDSSMANSYGVMGEMYFKRGLYDIAIKNWEKVIKIAPDSLAAEQAKHNIEEAKKRMGE